LPTVLGVDEAGRGAVLGPLVVAGVLVDEERLPRLWELGARDSKSVPRARRRAAVRRVMSCGARARAVVVPASTVDADNLTSIELDAAVRLIEVFAPSRVVLDTPVAPVAIPRFVAALSARSGLAPEAIAVFPKADRDHPGVAAASLLAKVVRDGYVLALRRRFGDFGWGYPGEPKVREYLAGWASEHGAFPPICRTRWKCAQDLLSAPRGMRASCAMTEPRAE
jgi:ribonuclease HII